MTKRFPSSLVWAAVVALLLAGAYVIVARNGTANASDTPTAYFH
jgi:hypothetical protein